MFAPQTIQIRYGQDGALAAGAAAAGAGQGYARQKAMDMQFLNADAERRQQADFADQQMQANRLQMANQLAMARLHGNPTFRSQTNSPFASAIRASKLAAINGAVARGDVDPNDPVIQMAAQSPDVNSAQTVSILEERSKLKRKESDQADTKKAKQAFIASQPDDVKNQLAPFVDDDTVNLSQVRIAAQNITNHAAAEHKSERYMQVNGIETEMRRVSKELEAAKKSVGDLGGDVHQPPAALNPKYADPNQSTFNTLKGEGGPGGWWTGFTGSLADAYKGWGETPTAGLVSGGNPEGMKAMYAYYQLKAQYDQLAAQRSAALADSTDTKTIAANLHQMSDADLLKALGK